METPLRILLIEDNELDAVLIEREFKKSNIDFILTRVEEKETFLRALNEFHPTIIISDYHQSEFSALDALQLMKQAQCDIPFIVQTGTGNEELAVEILKEGADDYILKKHIIRIPFAIESVLKKKELLREKKRAEEKEKEVNKRIVTIIEGINDAFITLDANWRYTYLNAKAATLSQRQPEELLGKNIWEEFPETVGKEFYKACYQAVETQQQMFAEVYYEPISKWFENRIFPTKDGLSVFYQDITERKKTKEQIQLLAHSVEQMNEIMVITDLNDHITFVNNSFTRLFGYTPDEVRNKHVSMLLSAKVSTAEHQKILALNRTETWSGELWNKTKDGRELLIYLRTSRIYDTHGNVIALVGIAEDITEQKQIEEKLLASEMRYRRLFEAAKDGILILDVDSGEIRDVNPFLIEMLGYSHEEFLGKQLWEIGLFKDIVANKDAFLKLQNEKYVRYENLPLETKDGHTIWVEFVSNVYDVGEKQVIQCNIRNITERWHAEEALKENKFQLEMAIRGSNTGLWDWNLNTNKVYFSSEWKKQIGYDDWEITNDFSEWQSRVHPDDLEHALLKVNMFLENHSPDYENEFRFRHKDGSYRWILARASLLHNAEGKPERMLGSHVDITERKYAEEELKKSEENYRKMLDRISDAFISFDTNWRYTYLNKKAAAIVNRTPEELVDKNVWEEFPESVGQPFHKAYYDAMATQQYIFLEEHYPPLGKWFENHIYPSHDGLSVFIRDTTEQQKAKIKLRQSEERFSSAFHVGPAGMTITRIADGTFLDANESFLNMFEFTREEVIGHTTLELNILRPAVRKKLIDDQIASGGLRASELVAHSKSGKLIHILFSSKPIVQDGESLHITIMIDITKRKQLEMVLAESEQRFRRIFEDAPYGIAMADLSDGRFFNVNKALCEMLGYTEVELKQLTFRDVTHPDFHTQDAEAVSMLKEGHIQKHFTEKKYVKKNGDEIWGVRALTKIQHADGNTFYALAIIKDITQRKHDEELLQQQKNELHKLTEQLLVTQENERKQISHELHDEMGQSLTMMKINIESLSNELKTNSSSTVQHKLAMLTSLSETVLDQIHEMTLELHPSMLDDLGLLPTLRWYLDKLSKQINITPHISTKNLELRLPAHIEIALYRILQEATTNIAKYAEAKNVTVEISRNASTLEMLIADDGKGFALKEIEQRTPEHFGIGIIGMKERVSLLNGTMRIETETGKGTKIIIQLPMGIA